MRTPVSSVAEWLTSLGMSEYADRFAQNDIDVDVLPELTDCDLEQLGISLGHRRRSCELSETLARPPRLSPELRLSRRRRSRLPFRGQPASAGT